MFNNPGRRIKEFAIGTFILNIVCLICMIFFMMSYLGDFIDSNLIILVALVMGVVGTFFSYIFTLFLYAMGELVEKATKTEENTREILRTSLLERQDRLDGVIESYEANSGKLSFDELIANEEDRVENKAKYDAVASLNFANLQRRFLDGKIDKEGYYNELLNIK